MKKLNKNEILNDKEYLKFNGVMKQINDMHLNDDIKCHGCKNWNCSRGK